MSENKLKMRLQQKRDYEVNWIKAGNNNFIPLDGEVIIYKAEQDVDGSDPVTREEFQLYKDLLEDTGRYSAEDSYTLVTYDRIKIGNGSTNIKDLPFQPNSGDLEGKLDANGWTTEITKSADGYVESAELKFDHSSESIALATGTGLTVQNSAGFMHYTGYGITGTIDNGTLDNFEVSYDKIVRGSVELNYPTQGGTLVVDEDIEALDLDNKFDAKLNANGWVAQTDADGWHNIENENKPDAWIKIDSAGIDYAYERSSAHFDETGVYADEDVDSDHVRTSGITGQSLYTKDIYQSRETTKVDITPDNIKHSMDGAGEYNFDRTYNYPTQSGTLVVDKDLETKLDANGWDTVDGYLHKSNTKGFIELNTGAISIAKYDNSGDIHLSSNGFKISTVEDATTYQLGKITDNNTGNEFILPTQSGTLLVDKDIEGKLDAHGWSTENGVLKKESLESSNVSTSISETGMSVSNHAINASIQPGKISIGSDENEDTGDTSSYYSTDITSQSIAGIKYTDIAKKSELGTMANESADDYAKTVELTKKLDANSWTTTGGALYKDKITLNPNGSIELGIDDWTTLNSSTRIDKDGIYQGHYDYGVNTYLFPGQPDHDDEGGKTYTLATTQDVQNAYLSANDDITTAIEALDSSVDATAEADGKVSVLTGVAQIDGKLTARTQVTLGKLAKKDTITSGDLADEIFIFDCGDFTEII